MLTRAREQAGAGLSQADSGRTPACYAAAMAAPATLLDPVTGRAAEQLLEYPYSDGKILMETDPHADSIVDMRYQLKTHFEARQDVYVAGSMALYYREGDPSAMLAPDVFVVLGVEKKERRSYMVWEEGGVVPAFVVEVASQSTSRLDATSKRATYERIGVREYWRFDPLGELIREGLVGWRLVGGSYEQVRAGRAGSWQRSEVLGLELRAEGRLLRFWDPKQGRALATHSESLRGVAGSGARTRPGSAGARSGSTGARPGAAEDPRIGGPTAVVGHVWLAFYRLEWLTAKRQDGMEQDLLIAGAHAVQIQTNAVATDASQRAFSP